MEIRKRYFLRAALVVLCFVFIGIAAVVAKHYYRLEIRNFTAIENQNNGFYIYPGTSISQALDMLERNYDIGSRRDFMLHAKLMHFHYPEPGYYEFDAEVSNREMIDRLKYGKQTPISLTWNNTMRTREQLAGYISSKLMMDSLALLQHLENDTFLAQYGMNKETSRCLFIPNTYEVYWTITPEQLFARMAHEFDVFWNEERRAKAEHLGLTPVEVAIIASIIEGESHNAAELPIIASLYLNRVRKGMLLQACPTVIYAAGDFSLRRVLYKHLQIDSPYNTYMYRGLPPGPIRCAAPQSIDFVLNAPKTDYLFMCANPALDGTHIFSATYGAHSSIARDYRHTMDTLYNN